MAQGPANSLFATLRLAWEYAAGARGRIALCCVLGIVRISIGLAFVWVSKMLVDAATSSAEVSGRRIVYLSVMLAAMMLVEMLLSLCVQYMTNQAEVRMKNRLRDLLYDHLLCVRHDAMSTTHSADYVSRLTEDTRVLADAVTRKLPDCLVFALQFVGAFVMLYYMSATLAVCVIVLLPVFLLLSKVYVMRTRRLTAEVRDTDSMIQASVQEGLQHHAVVQTLECENTLKHRLQSLQQGLYDWTLRRTRVGIYSRAMLRLSFMACYLTAFIWSVWHLHIGAITYGTMTAFLQLVGRIQHPVANITQLAPALVHAITSIDRVAHVFGMPREGRGACRHMQAPVGIRIEHITFGYKADTEVFSDFSHHFAPGSKTVIMGETGVGKSTLVRLILALLQPQKGSITMYDAQSEAPVSSDTRCNIVYVPQGNSLFEGTIRDNLLLGDPAASEEQMRMALHTAVASFVYDLPDGLDTRCGELGQSLSEGQAQRIAIARALLRRGAVMILDEYNSALDTATAATLIKRLTQERNQCTMIFISHRQEVAQFCDTVLNLDK